MIRVMKLKPVGNTSVLTCRACEFLLNPVIDLYTECEGLKQIDVIFANPQNSIKNLKGNKI